MSKQQNSVNQEYLEHKNIDDTELLVDPLSLLIRKWKFILFIVFLSSIAGIGFLTLKPKLYEAEATLMVSSGQIYSVENLENEEILRNQKLVSTYTEIARSKSIIMNVLKRLDMDKDPEEVSKILQMKAIGETGLIKISFKDRNPQIATVLVNEISEEFIDRIKEVMVFQNLKIIERAKVPTKALSKNILFIIIGCSIFGLLLSVFLLLIEEYLFGKIKDPKDFETIMKTQILINIPNLKNIKKGGKNE